MCVVKQNVTVALKFDLPIEGSVKSAHMILPQYTPLMVKVNEEIYVGDCINACNGKGQQEQKRFMEDICIYTSKLLQF